MALLDPEYQTGPWRKPIFFGEAMLKGKPEMVSPIYHETYEKGMLKQKRETAFKSLSHCCLCPRECGADRLSGDKGFCRTGKRAWVSSYMLHQGEESPLVGSGGSGTIFFTFCNLNCIFCQNFDISHEGSGEPVDDQSLAAMMISLQNQGALNINFVTPTHVVPQILSALELAVENGLSIPLVYNSSGYDKAETLFLLEGVMDIYMPDFKTWSRETAEKTMNAPDYPDIARNAVKEMHRQVGNLVLDDSGIARKGLLLRHLVMPGNTAGTSDIMRFLAEDVSKDTYVNIMNQYRPLGKAYAYKPISEKLSDDEYKAALDSARNAGIWRLDKPRRVFFAF